MIDIATWRARIGLYRVYVGPSGQKTKVLRPLASDGDFSVLLALSTITVVVLSVIIILLVLTQSGDIGRYYCVRPASILGQTVIIADGSTTGYKLEVFCAHLLRAMTSTTLTIPILYSRGISNTTVVGLASKTQLKFSGNIGCNCCNQLAISIFFNDHGLETVNTTQQLVKAMTAVTLIPGLYSKESQLMLSGDVELNPGPGTVADDNTAVCEVFRAHFHELVIGMNDPTALIPVLYAKKLISYTDKTNLFTLTGVGNIDKATRLLNAVETTIKAVPKAAQVIRVLCEAVNDQPALRHVANRITTALDQPALLPITPAAATPHTSALVQKFIDYLKYRYTNKSPILKEKLLKVRPKEFIHLNLISCTNAADEEDNEFNTKCLLLKLYGDVSAIKKKRIPMEMEDIGRSENKSVQHILVEGSPGIGKTMFSWELCRQWAEGKMLQDRDIVLMLQLRRKHVREAKKLSDLFHHDNDSIKQEVVEHITSVDGRGMFLVFEGYDELTENQRTEGSILTKLLIGDCLPKATIMVTSRPLASDNLCPEFRESVDQHIEVVGFNDKDIKSYVKSACLNHPKVLSDLLSYITFNPFVSSIMFIPLQCVILTGLYIEKWRENKAYAPTTLTQLYTDLLLSSLIRYISDHLVYSKQKTAAIKQLSDLPLEVQEEVWKLSQLAAEGLENRQFIFDSISCDHMGLMQSAEEERVIGRSVSYCFLHLTLQEYLAALHWSRISSKDMVHLVRETSLFPLNTLVRNGITKAAGYHWPALYFLSGLTKLTSIPIELLNVSFKSADQRMKGQPIVLIQLISDLQIGNFLSLFSVTSGRKCNPYFFQMLFETQSCGLITKLFKEPVSPTITNPLECFVTAWCVANSDPASQWSLEFENVLILEHFIKHFERFSTMVENQSILKGSAKSSSYGSIVGIGLNSSQQTISQHDAVKLIDSLSSFFPSLEFLVLCITPAGIIPILPLLCSIHKLVALKTLIVRENKGELPAAEYGIVPSIKCPKLTNIMLQGRASASLVQSLVLPNINTLTTIALIRCIAGAMLDFGYFCTCLSCSTCLERFSWEDADLSTHEEKQLMDALEQIRSLKVVLYKDAWSLTEEGNRKCKQAFSSPAVKQGLRDGTYNVEELKDLLCAWSKSRPLHSLLSDQDLIQKPVTTHMLASACHSAKDEHKSEGQGGNERAFELQTASDMQDEELQLTLALSLRTAEDEQRRREEMQQASEHEQKEALQSTEQEDDDKDLKLAIKRSLQTTGDDDQIGKERKRKSSSRLCNHEQQSTSKRKNSCSSP